jgi:hypothetical protein
MGVAVSQRKKEIRKRRAQRKKALRAARQMIMKQMRINGGVLGGKAALESYMHQLRPDLMTLNGDVLLEAFTGRILFAVVTQTEKNIPRQRAPCGDSGRSATAAPQSNGFLESYEWRRIRMVVLKRDGARCACCGATAADGVKMNVDHIKPRRLFPQLALDESNLQVLCEVCNHGKGNWDQTDWRPDPQAASALDIESFRHLAEIARGNE